MNGHKISITDPEHLGEHWDGPAPFEIEASVTPMGNWPNAPVVVNVLEGTQPDRAAALLREVAAALERNGRRWLPELVQDLNEHHPTEEVQEHLDKLAERGRMVDTVNFEDTHQCDTAELAVCRYRAQTVRTGYAPTVSLQIAAGATPKQVLALLAEITLFVKSDIKRHGADAFAPMSEPAGFTDDDGEVPF